MSRVLVVEDEQHLADGLRFNREAEGHAVTLVETGEQALETVESSGYDLVVLDVMLPGISGFDVAARLRSAGQFVPILMLTARGRPEDVLSGFEAGADDYLQKPFELAILLARIRGLIRRHEWMRRAQAGAEPQPAVQQRDVFRFRGKTIDFNTQELHAHGRTIPLTLMEVNLLRYLVAHEGRTVSRKAMLEDVWGVRDDTDTRAIDNFIVRLRRYIEDEPSRPSHVVTVRGVGYRFLAEP
jgi:DNA-binding response OmpR family regulator